MSTEQTAKSGGSCLCGAVEYEIDGPLRPVMYCHCEQCQKTSGYYVAATACQPEQITLTVNDGLKWYRSSPEAQRGFCEVCGCGLFWQPDHQRFWGIWAGTLDRPTGLRASSHIFVNMASDYYVIDDGLPQYDEDHPSVYPESFE